MTPDPLAVMLGSKMRHEDDANWVTPVDLEGKEEFGAGAMGIVNTEVVISIEARVSGEVRCLRHVLSFSWIFFDSGSNANQIAANFSIFFLRD